MKRVLRIGTVILFILYLVGFIGAGIASDGVSNSNKSELKVALLDYGPIGDHGWTYEGHVGAARMAKKLSYVNLSERENVASTNASQIMREYAENGYDLIFCHSVDFRKAIQEVAPGYPRVIFMGVGFRGTDELPNNEGIYYGRIYDAEYLTGIVAGRMTKTDKIALVASLPASVTVIGIDAFAKGVANANPKANINVKWIGSWYDPEKEKQLALSLINEGCDVITHWSDSDATSEAAEETGCYYISFDSNRARFAPHVFLTGAVWNWEPVMTDIVESVHNGTWQTHPERFWWYGVQKGGVELAPFSDLVPSDVRGVVEKQQREIAGGELAVFPGLSDEELQKIYYFESNVVGELPKAGT